MGEPDYQYEAGLYHSLYDLWEERARELNGLWLSLREECARIVEQSGCGECDAHKIIAKKIREYQGPSAPEQPSGIREGKS
jgi:hypothetical protein